MLPRWVDDQHFDGIMNYPVRAAILNYLNGNISAQQLRIDLARVLAAYPPENIPAMYNLLGSHDTERILTMLGGNLEKLKLAFLFLFALPGVPAIYYGDEVGLEGEKDPDCRRAFPWDEQQWKPGLREWVKTLIHARKASPALQKGSFIPLMDSNHADGFAFARAWNGDKVLVVLNNSHRSSDFSIPVKHLGLDDGHLLRSILDTREAVVNEGRLQLSLAPYQGIYLKKQ
jgi:glycosidase